MTKAVAVFTCDVWKSKDSMRLQGIFTNRKKLLRAIRHMKKNVYITLTAEKMSELKEWTLKDINDKFDYLYVEEITLNELNT
jgi:hypothetical protein